MKRTLFKYASLAVIALLGGTLSAQEYHQNDSLKKWTLQDCIQYAADNNYNINSLKLSKETSSQNYLLAKAALLPSLGASGNFTFNHSGTDVNGDNSINSSGSAGISSSWTLYNGGYLQNDKAQKKIAIQSADLFLKQGENNAALNITQTYLNILLDKENIKYNEDLVKTSEAQLEQIRQKFDVGSAAKKEVIQLEAQLAMDKYNLITSKSTENLDILALKQILLLPSDTAFAIEKPDTLFSLSVLAPLKDVQAEAIDFLPDIKISQLALESRQLDLSKAKSGYLPKITLSAGAGTSLGNSTNYSIGYSLNDRLYQQAGISASLPLFSNRVNKTSVALAKINIDQAKLDLKNTTIGVSQTVEKAYLNAVNSQNQYISANEQIKYSQESLRISSEELRIGSANMVDYIQQRNLYVQALQVFIQAKYNAAMYLKIYEFYKGMPLTLN